MLKRIVPIMIATIATSGLAGVAEARCSWRSEVTVLIGPGRIDCQPALEDCDAYTAILDDAAGVWLRAGGGQLRVVGHSDTSAEADDSLVLSERRASVVRDYLVAQGIPLDQIVIEARGETDLARPTADSVPEPLNNRVVVDFSDSVRLSRERYAREYRHQVEAALAAGAEPPPRPICL